MIATAFSAGSAVNYMSKRYFTYDNDQSVRAALLVEATIGYRFDAGCARRSSSSSTPPT